MSAYIPAIQRMNQFSEKDGWERNHLMQFQHKLDCEKFAANWAEQEKCEHSRAEYIDA